MREYKKRYDEWMRNPYFDKETKNLKKADGKKAVFLRKIYKKKNRKFVMMKRKNVLSISSQNQAQKDFGSTP